MDGHRPLRRLQRAPVDAVPPDRVDHRHGTGEAGHDLQHLVTVGGQRGGLILGRQLPQPGTVDPPRRPLVRDHEGGDENEDEERVDREPYRRMCPPPAFDRTHGCNLAESK
jgi:hypothetical protein